jgi:hypothetical protein
MARGDSRDDARDHNADWVRRAKPLDHHLDAENPFWVAADEMVFPAPLEMHIHRGIEVGVLMSGAIEIQFDDLRLSVGPGDLWLVSMWEPHAWRPLEPGTNCLVVIFLPEMLDEMLPADFRWLEMFAAAPRDRPIELPEGVRAEVNATARCLWSEVRRGASHWDLMVRLHLARLLVALHRDWMPSVRHEELPRISATQLSRLMPALAMASDNFRSKIGPRDAARACARACGLSASRFHHLFKEALGISFGRFRMRARLGHAAHRLLTSDTPVDAIAEETGFVDGSHLYRRFMAQYGCTPADYRTRGLASQDGDDDETPSA